MRKNPFLSKSYKWNRPLKNKQDELQLQLQILHYLKARGIPAGKIKTKGSFTKQGKFIKDFYQWTGLPDLLLFTPELIFLEVKINHNTQTSNQREFQSYCQKANVKYFVVRSLDDVQEIIK